MTESASARSLTVLTESTEKLNVETTPTTSMHNDQSDLHDDGSVDFWGEDGTVDNVPDGDLTHASVLDREWKRRHSQFHTMGYRDGITAGKEASAQEGFNVGFKQAVSVGYNWGLVRGISSAFSNLSDQLKEKLAGKQENRDRLQGLYESVQIVSTNTAVKLFNDSIQQTEAKQSQNHSEGNSHGMTDEQSSCNQLQTLFKELVCILDDSPEIEVSIESGKGMVG